LKKKRIPGWGGKKGPDKTKESPKSKKKRKTFKKLNKLDWKKKMQLMPLRG